MALKSLIDKLTGKSDRGSWQPAAGVYPRLTSMNEAALGVLKNKGGLFALWHRGVRPQWIYIGYAEDLSVALLTAQEDSDVVLYDRNDGVYVAWSECPVESRAAAVVHLRSVCTPAIETSILDELGPVDPETKPLEFSPPVD